MQETTNHTSLQPTSTDESAPPQRTKYEPRRSTRTKHTPTYLQDYHHGLSSHDTKASTSSRYPLSSVLSYSRLSPTHKHFVMSISSTVEPSSYAEASQYDCWIKAMEAELQALQSNNTWKKKMCVHLKGERCEISPDAQN